MKTIRYLLPIVITCLFIFSCDGPEGPEGPPGTDGVNGVDGVAGADGNETCLVCHNSTTQKAVLTAYEVSGHAAATTVAYAGSRNDCAMCHSNEGFIETQHTGRDTTAANIPIPTAISCGTCHDFHESLDFENDGPDYALRTMEPVDLLINDLIAVDLGGNDNLCVNCHQPRTAAPVDNGAGDFVITSSRYGPHHGTQSTVLYGFGAYKFAGVTYPTAATPHRQGGCTSCHMHGDPASHEFSPTVASCNECHDGASDFDIGGKQTEIMALMETLEGKLVSQGLISLDDLGDWRINTGTYSVDHAGAFYNFATMAEDRSMGVHNYPYTKAVLDASIAALP
jgi:hypothetical protein